MLYKNIVAINNNQVKNLTVKKLLMFIVSFY